MVADLAYKRAANFRCGIVICAAALTFDMPNAGHWSVTKAKNKARKTLYNDSYTLCWAGNSIKLNYLKLYTQILFIREYNLVDNWTKLALKLFNI